MNGIETDGLKERQAKIVDLSTQLERQARTLQMLGQFTHDADVNLPRAIQGAKQLLEEIGQMQLSAVQAAARPINSVDLLEPSPPRMIRVGYGIGPAPRDIDLRGSFDGES